MDFLPTPEQDMLRKAVARLAGSFGHPYFQAKAASGDKQDELWHELAAAGYLGVHLPEAYGGGSMGISELAIVTEEVAAAGCPLLLLLVSPAICGTLIAKFGDDDQRERWLPPLASGSQKMAFAITEPDAGSNTHNISTAARRDGGEWRLSGTKYYISGVDEAAQVLVVARTASEEATGDARLSLFVVDTDSPGLDRVHIP
ncbi:MAG: acyl-CoA dehydrogenase family protein, partial [Acidimicrobiales bacterium]